MGIHEVIRKNIYFLSKALSVGVNLTNESATSNLTSLEKSLRRKKNSLKYLILVKDILLETTLYIKFKKTQPSMTFQKTTLHPCLGYCNLAYLSKNVAKIEF
jgi:hypothetical protein